MSRSYRTAVVSALTLIFVSLGSQICSAQAPQADPKDAGQKIETSTPTVPVQDVKEGPGYYAPCAPQDYKRDSDLCAQWKAADAASEAAKWSGPSYRVALSGAFIALLTLGAAVAAACFAKNAAKFTKDGAAQAKRSADSAEETLIANERPWLKVDAKIAKDITFPLDGQGRKQASISVEFTVINFGKSPALYALVYANIWPHRWSLAGNLKSVFANELSGRKNWPKTGYTIFPGDSRSFHQDLIISPDEIESSRDHYRQLGAENFIAPDVLCCVVYVNPRTGIDHETGMVFLIHREALGTNMFDINEICVAAEIRLESAAVGGYIS